MVTLESKAVRRIALAMALCLGGGVFATQLTSYAQKERTTGLERSTPATKDGVITSSTSPDAGTVNRSGGDNKTNAFTDDGFWTTTGATGQLDEDSVGLADFRNFEVGFRNPPTFSPTTGTITIRYNITAVTDAIIPGINGAQRVKIRYRDSDGPGTDARVTVTLFRVPVNVPGRDQIARFDSNTFGISPAGAATFQTQSFTFCPSPAQSDFDFTNYSYYAEVQLTRGSSASTSNFGGLQIAESDSNPCT